MSHVVLPEVLASSQVVARVTVSHPSYSRRVNAGFAVVPIAVSIWCMVNGAGFAHILGHSLEQRFQRVAIGDAANFAGVIALGGHNDRIREACRLAARFPHLRVFVSGAGEERDIRAMLGREFETCAFDLESRSHNTHTNAVFTRAALRPSPTDRWLLATSASHMPRAMGAFRKAGMAVEPWPTYERDGGSPLPVAAAKHEWLGLLAYWVRGRTSELFPAPVARAALPTNA